MFLVPGGARQLSSRLQAILCRLERERGTAVSRHELLDAYWGKGKGSHQSLSKTIYELRTLLATSRRVRIESVYGHGYRMRVGAPARRRSGGAELARATCEEAAQRVQNLRAGSLFAALQMYETAINADPSYTPARVGYATAWTQLFATGQERSSVGWPQLRNVLEEATGSGRALAACLAYLGFGLAVFERDYVSAASVLEAAVREHAGAYHCHECVGRYLLLRGRPARAVEYLRVALDVNPYAMRTAGLLAYALGCAGDVKTARAQVDTMVKGDPANIFTEIYGGWIDAAWGNVERANELSRRAHERVPTSATVASLRAFALARAGARDAARRILVSLRDGARYRAGPGAVSSIAWQALDEPGKALGALQAGVVQRDFWVGTMINDPFNASIEGGLSRELDVHTFREGSPERPLQCATVDEEASAASGVKRQNASSTER